MKKTVLSAVQPTHHLHLGNYLGAIRNWIPYQKEYDCLFFAVDLHAITLKQDPTKLHEATLRAIATYMACGIDPKQSTLFVQSHVAAHSELAWVLTCHSSMGELSRMTQFKDKSQKEGTHIPTGLFVYPVLMAADILLYGTHFVPVGDDQKQHLELARDLAERMNGLYPASDEKNPTDLFVVPAPMIAKEGARIMSLQDPDKKMSKSDPSPGACVFLTDSDAEITKKFKRAVTDSGTEVQATDQSAGIRNLIAIQAACLSESYDTVLSRYVGRQYGYLKVETAAVVVATIAPIRQKTEEILQDESGLQAILADGKARANVRAKKMLLEVYKRLGFVR